MIVSLTTGPSSYKLDKISQLVSSGLEWGGFIVRVKITIIDYLLHILVVCVHEHDFIKIMTSFTKNLKEVLKTFTNTTERKKTDTKSEKSDQKMFDRFVEVTNMYVGSISMITNIKYHPLKYAYFRTEALNRVALDGDFAGRIFLMCNMCGMIMCLQ